MKLLQEGFHRNDVESVRTLVQITGFRFQEIMIAQNVDFNRGVIIVKAFHV